MTTTTVAPQRRTLPGARVLRDGRRLYWWAEILAVAIFYGVYSFIRNHSNASPAHAYRNATRLIRLEKWLHVYQEHPLHVWARNIRPLIIACNYFYGSFHFIVTIGAMVLLYRKFTDDYPLWRNTLATSTGIALIGFYSFPLMPPRLLDDYAQKAHLAVHYGFIDTLAKDPTFWSFNSGAMSKLSNQFAAMPSVHCCWALFCACVLFPRVRRPRAKVLAAVYPLITVSVIVFTANHYILDADAGFTIFGLGFLLANLFTRAGRGDPVEPEPQPAPVAAR